MRRTAQDGLVLNNDPETAAFGSGDDDADVQHDYYFTLVNSLAHEIRNPLNALSVNLGLLSREIGDGPGADKLAASIKEIQRLDELLTAFLRFARPKIPKAQEVNLARALAELETFIAPVAATTGALLEFKPIADIAVKTDANLLKQALLNVILNSFEAGADHVELTAEDSGEAIVVTVRDDGPGLAEPAQAFEPFYSTKEEGSGLGLPTARALAESLGGRLELGEASTGAEFKLTIPKKLP